MATYKSSVPGTAVDGGTFTYTPPNPPTTTNGTLGGTYTLADGTTQLTMTNTGTNGNQVQFDVATGGTTYNFNGAYASGTGNITGHCVYPSLKAANDAWTATEQ